MKNQVLYKKMSKIAQKMVSSYLEDFTEDKKILLNPEDNKYIWIARRSGTLLCPMKKFEAFLDFYVYYASLPEATNGFFLLDIEKQTVTKIVDRKKFLMDHLEQAA